MPSILDRLNDRQRQAASSTGGPLLILAGAGSGKTRTLTHRIAHLIEQGVDSHKILAVTFTNKAAGEMGVRVRDLVGLHAGCWIGTFHSVGARMLRYDGHLIGLEKNFSIYDSDDSMTAIKQVLKQRGLDEKSIQPTAVRAAISNAKNSVLAPGDLPRGSLFEECVAEAFPAYRRLLSTNNAVDFDDLLIKPLELFQERPDVLAQYQSRFEQILIDEYQDTNRAQYLFVKELVSSHRNVCAVGDDDQSIYGWRGADISNIFNFESDYPDALVVRLEQNYRSTKRILEAAGAVVSKNRDRKGKTLWTDNEEGDKLIISAHDNEQEEGKAVAEMVAAERSDNGMSPKDIVVLYRTNAQSRALEDALRRATIPYRIFGGVRFYERKEIKDALSYLRVLANPDDSLSLLRIVNVPKRGIGLTSIGKLTDYAKAKNISLLDACHSESGLLEVKSRAAGLIRAFVDMIDDLLVAANSDALVVLVGKVIEAAGFVKAYEAEGSIESQTRADNIKELVSSVAEFTDRAEESGEDASLEGFLENVSLVTDTDRASDEENAVTLMTMHMAKGLEFPIVWLSGLEDGLFPLAGSIESDEAMEEERRLFYVGLTRAEKRVYMSYATTRRRWGKIEDGVPSRFLEEIPEGAVEHRLGTMMPPRLDRNWKARPAAPSRGQESRGVKRMAPKGDRSRETSTGQPRIQDAVDEFVQAMPNYEEMSQDVNDFLQVGRIVVHPKFGRGTITERTGIGEDAKVTIKFQTYGVKKIVARYAQFEPG